MKDGAAGINAHISEGVTTLAECCKIVRTDGVTLGFTSHDLDLTYDGVIYEKESSFSRSDLKHATDLAVSDMDLDGLIDSTQISESDIRSGKYQNAAIYFFTLNWANIANGIIKLQRGWIGDIRLEQKRYVAELNGISKLLQREALRSYLPICDAEFGDAGTGCGYDLSAVTQSGTVLTVTDNKNFDTNNITFSADDVFNLGRVTFTSGANNGLTIEVKDSVTTGYGGTIELYVSAPFTISVGDGFNIIPGCDKTFSTCQSYSQAANFRGFPYIPGEDSRWKTNMALREANDS